jgi:signal transduction histidine kinase
MTPLKAIKRFKSRIADRKLGLRQLLYLMVVVPLLALGLFGGALVLDIWGDYRAAEQASSLEQLVSAASRLTFLTLDAESKASRVFVASGAPDQRAELEARRKRSDDAILAFRRAAATAGLSDARGLDLVSDIERRLGGLAAFRENTDARTMTRRDSLELFQPLSARLADLVLRISAVVEEFRTSQLLLALHAIMQMNEGSSIENGRSDVALKDGKLESGDYQLLLRGLWKQAAFGLQFDNFGPALVREQLLAFNEGPESRTIEALRPVVLDVNNGGRLNETDTLRWRDAMEARRLNWLGAVQATVNELTTATDALRESEKWQLTGYAGMTALVIATVMGLVTALARSITGPLVQMIGAVEGFARDERITVPVDAAGEIGVLARAFERMMTDKIAAEEQIRHSQKMEAIGQLTGGIAHDFNNMLTVITGTIEMLEEGLADRPELAAIGHMIGEAADRGAELTSQLLAFARKQPLQPGETDINGLIGNACKLIRPVLRAHIEIEAVLPESTWPALVDPSQLTTALLNLAVNARDAMPDGGKLTLETSNVVLDHSYARIHGNIRPGNYVMIAVSDTGVGIPEEILGKVFEPFFSTKALGKGTGLGLSMVYGFVTQSGGHINVYSEKGHGTTFRIYLPQAGKVADTAAVPDPVELEGGAETILAVEDDPLVRSYVIAQLQSLGYRTLTAANAAEALAVIDNGTAFDLLFTDVIMTGTMNGRQLANEAARRRPGLKVLFTSGYSENAIIHHGRLDPGVLLLAKPYRKADLARMIRRAIGDPWAAASETGARVTVAS